MYQKSLLVVESNDVVETFGSSKSESVKTMGVLSSGRVKTVLSEWQEKIRLVGCTII